MCRRSLVIGVLAGLAPAALAAPAQASSPPAPPPSSGAPAPAVVPGELLVRFDGVSGRERAVAVAHEEATIVEDLGEAVAGLTRVRVQPGKSLEETAAALEARPDVRYAEPNPVVHGGAVPNDSRLGELWGLRNTGQTLNGVTGTTDADIDAPEAWDVTTGSPEVVVAVVDSGVAYDHPDLAPNMWVNSDEVAGNGLDDDGNGFVDDARGWDFHANDADPRDEHGHGTHVAGTIGARGNNDATGPGATDVVGVNWQVGLMSVRVLGPANVGSLSSTISGLAYAADNGAKVVNASLGRVGFFSQAELDVINAHPDTLFVFAAMNGGPDGVGDDNDVTATYPCSYPAANNVCVAATTAADQLAAFSNFGDTSVDLAAPGTNVLSTYTFRTAFSDAFEAELTGRWVVGGTPGTWGRSTERPATGAYALTDSPAAPYGNNADHWAAIASPLDLTGPSGCIAQYGVFVASAPNDVLWLEAATDPNGPWTGLAPHFDGAATTARTNLGIFGGRAGVHLRFRFESDSSGTGEGAYVDDLRVFCPSSTDATSFTFLSGTSMATPHVAGIAALVTARFPGITTATLKNRVLSTVEAKASLAGRVATGGRANALRALTVGNLPPTARAGADRTADAGTTVTLDGRSSSDPESGGLSFLWVQVAGPATTIQNSSSSVATVRAPSSATRLVYRLRVTDPAGNASTDDVVITVRAPK